MAMSPWHWEESPSAGPSRYFWVGLRNVGEPAGVLGLRGEDYMLLSGICSSEAFPRLAAAAPELLEVSKRALDCLTWNSTKPPRSFTEQLAVDELRKAIARAEGREP